MIGNTPFLACRTLFPSQLWECEKAQLAPSVDFYKEKITGIQEALQNERWQMGLSEKRVPQNRMFYHHLLYETIWGVSPTSKPTWEIGTPWCFVPCCHDSHKFHPVIWHVCNAHMQCAKYAMHIYYIYMCVYICVYIYICICVCIYIYICVGGKNRYNLPCVCFKGLFIYIWMDIFSCSCVHLSCRFNPVHTSQITPVQNMFAFYLFNITPTHLKQKTNADECGGKKVLQKW